jgi:rare lipoprotein A
VIRRAHLKLCIPVLVIAGALVAPQSSLAGSSPSGQAGSGGVGMFGSPTGGAGTGRAQVHPGNVTVTASGDGITIATTESALQGGQLEFNGSTMTADAGDLVDIERSGPSTGNEWLATANGTVQPNGSFSVIWRVNHSGRFSIRAVLEKEATPARSTRTGSGTSSTASSAASSGAASPQPTGAASPSSPSGSASPAPASPASTASSPSLMITVYRPSIATIYGPGLWGNHTACGQTLRRGTLGVASRTLKCGTPVSIYYRGRTLVVPVIDRGPFANHANWDLTDATAKALGISTTVTLGAVALVRN